MNSKKILCLALCAAMICSALAACSKKKETVNPTEIPVATSQEAETTTQPEQTTTEPAQQEIVSFTAKDSDGNEMTLVPVFDKDGKTVIAGYVISAKDKDNKPLVSDSFKLMNKVLSATDKDSKITLDTAADKSFIVVETYSDLTGNLVAIKDTKDLNKNNNKNEFLRLTSKVDENKIKHYVLEYTVVTITQEKDKYFMTDGDKKTEVKRVDSANVAVKNKVKKDTESNKAKTTKPSTTKKKGKNKPTETAKKQTTTAAPEKVYTDIVLHKNRKASCKSANVSLATGEIYITKGGDYRVTSDTDVWHGQIIIKLKNTEKCEIRFENVKISNDTKNIIQIIDTSIKSNRSFLEAEASAGTEADDEIKEVSENDKAPNVDLAFPTGTSSSFETSANSYTGVIYNESKLTIKGNGKAHIESKRNANNCICSTKSVSIKNVSLSLATAQNNNTSSLAETSGSAKGIFSYGKVNIESGSVNIRSNGDGIRCDELYVTGGTTDIKSSACDGIDADDAIVISAGIVKSIALEKSSFKVRRVNNTEKGTGKGVRPDKNDTFEINGGTVTGESKKITTVQPSSKQASVTCKIVKQNANSDLAANESKVPAKLSISGVKTSENACTKFLYSSSKVTKGKLYKVTAERGNSTTMVKEDWNSTVGTVRVLSSTNK